MPLKEIEAHVERTRKHHTLGEFAQVAAFLPEYFENKAELVEYESTPTRLKEVWPKLLLDKKDALVPPALRIFKRPVAVLLETANTFAGDVTAPVMHTDTSGFWKDLDPTEYGVDRSGKPSLGRTWVTKETSWKVYPAGVSITVPRAVAPSGPRPGWLYVLRCAAHASDIFKVGRTSRDVDQRRGELSSATGVPDEFLEVVKFQVGNDVSVEAAVHRALRDHRLKNNREFFKIDLPSLIELIRRVLQSMGEPS